MPLYAPNTSGVLIERYSGDGSTGTKTFSSISNAYSALRIVFYVRSSNASVEENVLLRLNGDTGANYDWQLTFGFGTTASATEGLADTNIMVGGAPGSTAPTGAIGIGEIIIPRYSDTTFHKSCVGISHAKRGTTTGTLRARNVGGHWRSANAITSATVYLSAGNYVSGSVVELWGI